MQLGKFNLGFRGRKVMADVNDPRRIGNYDIITELGKGTFGRVYQGKHIVFPDRIVAIKLMRAAPLHSQQERDLFLEEARLLVRLKHPYILPLIDAGIYEQDLPYLVTEYAAKGSLLERIRKQQGKPLPLEEAITILSQIGEALQYVHQQDIVHRDLKPENILFKTDTNILLADFGIAKMVDSIGIRQGTIIGTPPYMAPEQFRGMASRESDQYALGCIAYELFTGRQPFIASDMVEMMFKHLMEQPIPPRHLNPELPEHIERAILKAMAKDRTERHNDVPIFIKALQQTKEQWLNDGITYYKSSHYEAALAACEQAIQLTPDAQAYNWKGNALYMLKRYEEAITAYEQAIRLHPNFAQAYSNKGLALYMLKRYEEALPMYEQAIQLDPKLAQVYNWKGNTLYMLKSYEEAIVTLEQAIQLDPQSAYSYNWKGNALYMLKRYEEAITAYEQAIQLDPKLAHAHNWKDNAVKLLRRTKGAKQLSEKSSAPWPQRVAGWFKRS